MNKAEDSRAAIFGQHKGRGKSDGARMLLRMAHQRPSQIGLMGVARPFMEIDRIVALDQRARDADRIAAIGAEQVVHVTLGGQRGAGVAQQHRRAAKDMRGLRTVRLHLCDKFAIGLDRLAEPSEPMQQERRHARRMGFRRDRERLEISRQRAFIVAHGDGAQAHLMQDRQTFGIERQRRAVVFERRRDFEAA